MKLRNGFVSNSSSSSFIVAFPKKPDSVEVLMEMMFPGWQPNQKIEQYGHEMTIVDICSVVFRDIQNQSDEEKADKFKLVQMFKKMIDVDSYYYEHSHDVSKYPKCRLLKKKIYDLDMKEISERRVVWERHNITDWGQYNQCPAARHDMSLLENYEEKKQILEHELENMELDIAQKLAERFLKDNKTYFIYQLEYADEDGQSLLEHGDIFRNIPHHIISNH